eukprot:m.70052 g.70052  ORF g.70052 m.70052 type:complete len:93 (+) comp8296_c0_seq4:1097-1375(+)
MVLRQNEWKPPMLKLARFYPSLLMVVINPLECSQNKNLEFGIEKEKKEKNCARSQHHNLSTNNYQKGFIWQLRYSFSFIFNMKFKNEPVKYS